MSQIKKLNNRMEITPKAERLGGVLSAEANDEAVTLGQLRGFGVTKPYKVYTALMTQSSTNPPTVTTILENTIGAIVWSYSSTGVYIGTLTGAFNITKTFVSIANNNLCFLAIYANDANTVRIATSNTAGAAADDLLTGSIEIRVYN